MIQTWVVPRQVSTSQLLKKLAFCGRARDQAKDLRAACSKLNSLPFAKTNCNAGAGFGQSGDAIAFYRSRFLRLGRFLGI
jgi:hypothetical protein